MVTDIVVIFLLLIGLGTVIYWIMKFCVWFVDKLIKKSDDYETMREKNYAAMEEEMKQFDQQTLNLAYLYAKSLTSFGVDITEKWETVTEQSANLEKAYRKGFYEGVSSALKEDDDHCRQKIVEELEHLKSVIRFNGIYNEQIEDLIDMEIKGWKGENNE